MKRCHAFKSLRGVLERAALPACLLALAGCLAPAPEMPRNWVVTPRADKVMRAASPSFGTARFATLTVRAPYDRASIAVWRADGSVAFDGYNVFAAPPAALLKGPATDILEGSGLFSFVVPSHSTALNDVNVEIAIRELALDCREAGRCEAVVSCIVRIVAHREILSCAAGEGRSPATGDYAAAFSSAFTAALTDALAGVYPATKEQAAKAN